MHVSAFSSSDREVIRFLFNRSDWADLYEMHVAFDLTPAQILDILERLVGAGFAEMDGVKARLNPNGRDWVVAARKDIFFSTDRENWRPASEELTDPMIEPFAPYLPDLGMVDTRFFERLALDSSGRSGMT